MLKRINVKYMNFISRFLKSFWMKCNFFFQELQFLSGYLLRSAQVGTKPEI